jgi:hypothetical protein
VTSRGLLRRARAAAVVLGASLAAAALAGAATGGEARGAGRAGGDEPPARLADTGLFADVAARRLGPGVLPFAPQYALWTDGAAKRRWIRLPPGTAIDASDPDRWRFPRGTRLWKEFSLGGRPIETRLLSLGADGVWRYATYLWSADGREARRAPDAGARRVAESRPGVPYDVPAVGDCRACHEAHPSRVLGFGALQLSPDRDPGALHAADREAGSVDLADLDRRGLIRGLPRALLARPPRIEAGTPRARAALGWLHANCASCHNAGGALAGLGLDLEQRAGAPEGARPPLATAAGVAARFRPGGATWLRIAPGRPEESLLVRRTASRNPIAQMPPLGTHLVDEEAVALLSAFVREDLADPHATRRTHQRTHQEEKP